MDIFTSSIVDLPSSTVQKRISTLCKNLFKMTQDKQKHLLVSRRKKRIIFFFSHWRSQGSLPSCALLFSVQSLAQLRCEHRTLEEWKKLGTLFAPCNSYAMTPIIGQAWTNTREWTSEHNGALEVNPCRGWSNDHGFAECLHITPAHMVEASAVRCCYGCY